jgi:hypothetical protein
MAIRASLFAVPALVVAGLVLLLNALDATAGVAVAALCSVAVLSGAAFGYFADELPTIRPFWRSRTRGQPLEPAHRGARH